MDSFNLTSNTDIAALEKAAKYVCTSNCGLCPMVTEGFSCLKECDLDTIAWQCWVRYFRERNMD